MIAYKKDSIIVTDIGGNKTVASLQQVQNTKPMTSSLMPQGLDKILGKEKMKDLMAYWLTHVNTCQAGIPLPAAYPELVRSQQCAERQRLRTGCRHSRQTVAHSMGVGTKRSRTR